jgi:lysophospholipase L1-like esterase
MTRTYLALGDSMSIDDYTGVAGGGAAAQFYNRLGEGWRLLDRSADGCTIDGVPRRETGHVLTLTIGGNDALQRFDEIVASGVGSLVEDHRQLLSDLRLANPDACLIVGNVYRPQVPLPAVALERLRELNEGIAANIASVDGFLADIHAAFLGHEDDYLCLNIEPTLSGATAIASLFHDQFARWSDARRGQ